MRDDEAGKGGQPQTRGILQICLDFQRFLKWSGVVCLFVCFYYFTHSCKDEKLQSLPFFLIYLRFLKGKRSPDSLYINIFTGGL